MRNLLDKPILVRKLAGLMFRIHEFSIDMDVENTSAAAHELGGAPEALVDFGCQTDSRGFIVSLHAVGDRDFHA